MSGRRSGRLEVRLGQSGTPTVAPVPKSRIKMMATVLGVTLAIAPGPWAFKRFEAPRANNETKPAGTHEQISILPGLALASRNGQPQPAAYVNGDKVELDLGELRGGSSSTYSDLLRVRNDGQSPVLLYVDPSSISQAPMHASVSGEEAPGAFWVKPQESKPVDLSLVADLAAQPGDLAGDLAIRSASGMTAEKVPARMSVAAPTRESVLSALLGAEKNPESGLGKLGEVAAGLEAPDFVVEGVWDGGAYPSDITFTWRPLGPLTNVRGTLDDGPVGQTAMVTDEGQHVLRLQGLILGAVPFTREISFSLDKNAPVALQLSPPVMLGKPATFTASVNDLSTVAGVEFVVLEKVKPARKKQPSKVSPVRQAVSEEAAKAPEAETPEGAPKVRARQSLSEARAELAGAAPVEAPRRQSSKPQSAPEPVRLAATQDSNSGLWVATTELKPGKYLVHVEAIDSLGHKVVGEPQLIQVVGTPEEIPDDMPEVPQA
ncbi:MAG TPA: hypothetical protein VNE62_07680 [Actinomycetota bacterium]|nr:hypothetical protein [Actinomycetota bacterium]